MSADGAAEHPPIPEGYDPLTEETGYPYHDLLGFRITDWAQGYARV